LCPTAGKGWGGDGKKEKKGFFRGDQREGGRLRPEKGARCRQSRKDKRERTLARPSGRDDRRSFSVSSSKERKGVVGRGTAV